MNIQGGSNVTGTVYTCLHTNHSRSYLNHLVLKRNITKTQLIQVNILPKHAHITKPTHTHTHTHAYITKPTHTHTPTHYKTHTYTHPHITKPTRTHTHTLQNNIQPQQHKLKQTQNKIHANEIVTV